MRGTSDGSCSIVPLFIVSDARRRSRRKDFGSTEEKRSTSLRLHNSCLPCDKHCKPSTCPAARDTALPILLSLSKLRPVSHPHASPFRNAHAPSHGLTGTAVAPGLVARFRFSAAHVRGTSAHVVGTFSLVWLRACFFSRCRSKC